MDATKRRFRRGLKENHSINDLRLLVDFLNFDFSSGTQKKAEKDVREFLDRYRLTGSGGKRKGSILKETLLYYLKPLVTPESIDKKVTSPSQAIRSYLVMLVNEINHLDLRPQWVVDWGNYKLYQSADKKDYFPPSWQLEWDERPMRKVKNPGYRYLRSGQKKLKIEVGKEEYEEFIVRKDSFQARSPEQHLYGIIIEALENGEFKRIKKCPECQRFFVAGDLRQTYCTPKCKEARDRRDAPDRVKRSREKRKKEMHGF